MTWVDIIKTNLTYRIAYGGYVAIEFNVFCKNNMAQNAINSDATRNELNKQRLIKLNVVILDAAAGGSHNSFQ